MNIDTKTVNDDRLHVNLAGIAMNTPVMTASGTFGFGEEFADFVDLNRLGGVMVKGTTLKPRHQRMYDLQTCCTCLALREGLLRLCLTSDKTELQ